VQDDVEDDVDGKKEMVKKGQPRATKGNVRTTTTTATTKHKPSTPIILQFTCHFFQYPQQVPID